MYETIILLDNVATALGTCMRSGLAWDRQICSTHTNHHITKIICWTSQN